MKIFNFRNRHHQNANQIPHVRVGVAHITGPGKLRSETEHLVFESNDTRQVRIDAEGLEEVIAYGEVSLSTGAMRLLDRHQIAMSWMSPQGSFVWGRLVHDHSDRSLTRLLQYQAWEDPQWQLSIAKDVVMAKIVSVQAAVRHYQRQGKDTNDGLWRRLEHAISAVNTAHNIDQLRGIEGNAAALWYNQYGTYFQKPWHFSARNRRPPKDPVNALLSLGYMSLYRRAVARTEARGYEAALGALHEYRPGRLSMACDLMEPLRIPVVDRWVLAICRQRIVKPDDFTVNKETGSCEVVKAQLGQLLGRLEEHWHQGMFQQHLDELLKRWTESLRDRISQETSRAAAYLKRVAIKAANDEKDHLAHDF